MPTSILVTCAQCNEHLQTGKKFCSRQCKSESQKKRIMLVCVSCNKSFSIWPYLKRKTNYCSTECYWNSTRRKEERFCKYCKKSFLAPRHLLKKGYGFFCSRECQHKTYPARIIKNCLQCKKKLEVQPSKFKLVKFCSKVCTDNYYRDYVERICKHCKKEFQLPRFDLNRGRGTFCTWNCFMKYQGPSSLEEKMMRALDKAKIKYLREVKFQRFHVDFIIKDKKLAIECDGEHWHMNPVIQDRDRRKDKLLKSLGYKIIRFSGKEINKFSEANLGSLILAKI